MGACGISKRSELIEHWRRLKSARNTQWFLGWLFRLAMWKWMIVVRISLAYFAAVNLLTRWLRFIKVLFKIFWHFSRKSSQSVFSNTLGLFTKNVENITFYDLRMFTKLAIWKFSWPTPTKTPSKCKTIWLCKQNDNEITKLRWI